MNFHEVCELFPAMDDAALQTLADDIKANGLREPIWTHEGLIIDGRNRYKACQIASVEPAYREWSGDGDVLKFVVSLNLHRRHLSENQRAMIAAKIANRPIGNQPTHSKENGGLIKPPSNEEAADLLNVGRSSVVKAKFIRREAIPEVVAAVESGEMSLHAAKQIADEPKEKQADALSDRRNGMHRKPAKGNGSVNTRKLVSKKGYGQLQSAIHTLSGIATGLDTSLIKDEPLPPDEAEQWDKELSLAVNAINRFRRQLKEQVNV